MLNWRVPRRSFVTLPPPKPKDGIYTPEKDPMAHMTEAQKQQIRKDIQRNTRRAASYGYGFIGVAGLLMMVQSWTKGQVLYIGRHRTQA